MAEFNIADYAAQGGRITSQIVLNVDIPMAQKREKGFDTTFVNDLLDSVISTLDFYERQEQQKASAESFDDAFGQINVEDDNLIPEVYEEQSKQQETALAPIMDVGEDNSLQEENEQLRNQVAAMEDHIKHLEEELSNLAQASATDNTTDEVYAERARAAVDVLAEAQIVANRTTTEAENQAHKLLEEAQASAEAAINQANEEIGKANAELSELAANRGQFLENWATDLESIHAKVYELTQSAYAVQIPQVDMPGEEAEGVVEEVAEEQHFDDVEVTGEVEVEETPAEETAGEETVQE